MSNRGVNGFVARRLRAGPLGALDNDCKGLVLQQLCGRDVAVLLLAGAPPARSLILLKFAQGRRIEYAPFLSTSIAFGSHQSRCFALFTCGQAVDVELGGSVRFVLPDYQMVHKTVALLRHADAWCPEHAYSRSVEALRERLVRAL